MPSWKLTFKLLERLAKAYTWVGSILLLVGLACGVANFPAARASDVVLHEPALVGHFADSLLDCRP